MKFYDCNGFPILKTVTIDNCGKPIEVSDCDSIGESNNCDCCESEQGENDMSSCNEFLRKGESDILSGTQYVFDISGSNFRIKNGKAQIRADNGAWYNLIAPLADGDKLPYLKLSDDPDLT